MRRNNGLNVALNIAAIIDDAEEEVRPDADDYSIVVRMGKEEKASSVTVRFFNDETYHKVLTYLKVNSKDMVGTASGKLIKYQAFCGDYAVELNMEQHLISRTSARTADPKTVKNVDESYNEYRFIIKTDVEPWSKALEKQAIKDAKRAAKGKKMKNVEDLM